MGFFVTAVAAFLPPERRPRTGLSLCDEAAVVVVVVDCLWTPTDLRPYCGVKSRFCGSSPLLRALTTATVVVV